MACNVLTQQKASPRCNICGVGPKDINNIVTFATRLDALALSRAHSRTRDTIVRFILNFQFKQQLSEQSSSRTKKNIVLHRTSLRARINFPALKALRRNNINYVFLRAIQNFTNGDFLYYTAGFDSWNMYYIFLII